MSWHGLLTRQKRFEQPRTAALFVGALAAVACIDTEVTPLTVTDCAALGASDDNIVFITAALESWGHIQCSGVLVTRTLIVTSLGCTMVPNELAHDYGREAPDAQSSGAVFFSGAAEAADCNAGVAQEDGSFSTLYGAPIAAEQFAVYLSSERIRDAGHGVSRVWRAGATRCSPGIALLQLSAGLGPSPLPVRFYDTLGEEPLLLSYLSVDASAGLLREDQVTVGLPPSTGAAHVFEVPDTCPDQSGGALFSATTGALVGVLDSSIGGARCGTLGQGTAVRIAPFRRLLVEAAAPEPVRIESGPSATNVVLCSPPW